VFSVPQLIGAFDLAHVNHRKAAVNMSKLDFLNKMTLRRKAGRLGEDGVMVSLGKKSEEGAAGEEGRKELVESLQKLLKQRELFAGWSVPRLHLRGDVDVTTANWSTTWNTSARSLMPSW
jgi:glutamyl-tRNA synthetase